MSRLIVASDGLFARELPEWSREKLFYIRQYLGIFCVGMKDKWSLVYADLLSGPGRCVDIQTGEEQNGSALLAVERPEFQRLFLNDVSPAATHALIARTASEPPGRVQIATADCNAIVETTRAALFPAGMQRRTLGLAVIDPTAFQMSFDSIARLSQGLRLDLIIVVMTGFIRRFISTPEYQAALDAFFGTQAWRGFVDERNAGDHLTYRKLLDLYEGQLGQLGYLHVNDDQRMLNSKGSTIYHLVFASKHPRGADFFRKISQKTYRGQRRLPMS